MTEFQKHTFAALILFFYAGMIFGQSPRADSLLHAMENAASDSLKLDARLLFVQEQKHNYSTTSAYIFEGIKRAKHVHDFYFSAQFYHAAGIMHAQIGSNDSALFYFSTALNYRTYSKNIKGIGASNLGMSNVYRTQGDFKNALKYGLEAEKAFLTAQDTSGLAKTYNALGLVFKQQQDYPKASVYYSKSLEQSLLTNDGILQAGVYSNLGTVFQEQKLYDSALVYHREALQIRKKSQDEVGIGITYGNLGLIFMERQNTDSAFYYTNLALAQFEQVNFTAGMEQCYLSLGLIWQQKGNHAEAVSALKKAETIARSAGFLPDLLEITQSLAHSYSELGKYKEATLYLTEFIVLEDSLKQDQQSKEVQKLELEFEYRQKQLADSLKIVEKEKLAALETEKQKQINEEQTARFRIYTLSGVAVLVLILCVVFILYRSNKKQKESNLIIADQKHLVEEKNKEITDSINYAKRIQEAILPPAALIEKRLPQSFVLYQPKDIVAGDFYWLESFADASDSKGKEIVTSSMSVDKLNTKGAKPVEAPAILIAAADCTGHGVPGAMVSVVCSNALNRTVKELGIKTPGKILDTVRSLVIETFEKSENEVKDGMDIALISIQKTTADNQWHIQFAGANNPLWIIKKGQAEIIEIKGDSQPIGKFADLKSFTNHEQLLETGDCLYIFTDGYQDQFGGPKGKKFKAANLKKLLIAISHQSIPEQKKLLEKEFEMWRGNLEQLDDVCVIGIRL